MLIALAVLAVVLVVGLVASQVYLNTNRAQQIFVSQSSNLRRAMEIVTEAIRNDSFGILASVPYPSDSSDISVLDANSTAAYQTVGATGCRQSSCFTSADNVNIYAPTLSWGTGTSFILLNPDAHQATFITASQISQTANYYNVVHNQPRQYNAVCFSPNTVAMQATALGFHYDAAHQILVESTGLSASNTQPVAFDISGFQVSYISQGVAYSSIASVPAGDYVSQIAIKMTAAGQGGQPSRSLTGYIELTNRYSVFGASGQAITFYPSSTQATGCP
jgi:type II secretory pathway component PulJ